jgi:ribosomal protein S18 acetylase RimI-like enzyme
LSGAGDAVTVRRVRIDDTERVRELRLEALRDPVASIAFLETVEVATARPMTEWEERTHLNATSDQQAQFVAETGEQFVGAVTVFPRRAGEPDYFQRIPEVDTATLVGVYVSPQARGRGVIDALIAEAIAWSRDAGYPELTLDVHERNAPAIAAYRRSGFEVVGEFHGDDGREIAMAVRL